MENKQEKDSKKGRYKKLTIPIEYISALADRIHQSSPTKEILISTLSDLYSVAATKGVFWRMGGEKRFRDQREADFQQAWKQEQDNIWGIPATSGNKKKKKKRNKKSVNQNNKQCQ